MGTEWIVAFIIIGLLLLIAATTSWKRSSRWLRMLVVNLVIGAVLVFLVNIAGNYAGFHIPINPITAVLAGFLRFPGLIAIVLIKLFIM